MAPQYPDRRGAVTGPAVSGTGGMTDMWAMAGLVVMLLAAVRGAAYAVWLWENNQYWAAAGVILLIACSVAIPVFATVRANI